MADFCTADLTTRTFTGTANPGDAIKVTSSFGPNVHTAVVDKCGNWEIVLTRPPQMYTSFEIWASAPDSGMTSDKVKFTFGGNNPKLADIYASKNLVFGASQPGTEIVAYGPDGHELGRSFVFGQTGLWTVRFHKAVDAGARVCIIARQLNGNCAMPVFTDVKAFAVDERNVGHISGSGAEPGDYIHVLETASGQQIAETAATDAGSWSVSFAERLAAGTRIAIQRVHTDGSTSEGPVFTVMPSDCLAPIIDTFSAGQLGGIAATGLTVSYAQHRDGQIIYSATAEVDESGTWISDSSHTIDFQDGDILTAKTQNADETAESLVSSNVTIGGYRPGVPIIDYIDENGAQGWAEPHKNVVLSTKENGLICLARAGWDGYWSADWSAYSGTLPTTTLVVFEVFESLIPSLEAPTSMASARYANSAATDIAIPDMTLYIGKEFGGTEATPDTWVKVYNAVSGVVINEDGAKVQSDTTWDFHPLPEKAPDSGSSVYAQAWRRDDQTGNWSDSSNPGPPVTVDTFVPPPPTGIVGYPATITGLEILQSSDVGETPFITIYICPQSDPLRTPVGNSGHLQGQNWTINPVPNRTPGELMYAWAQTDAGAQSTLTPFTIQAVSRPIPPAITNWLTPRVSGNGQFGTTVELYLNEVSKGTAPVKSGTDGYSWEVNVGVTPSTGDKLKAIATDSDGNESDVFYIIVGDNPTILTTDANNITTTGAAGTVSSSNQRVMGWRNSDGLKVFDLMVTSKGPFSGPYLPGVTVEHNDLIKFSSQNAASGTEGTMTHYNGNTVV